LPNIKFTIWNAGSQTSHITETCFTGTTSSRIAVMFNIVSIFRRREREKRKSYDWTINLYPWKSAAVCVYIEKILIPNSKVFVHDKNRLLENCICNPKCILYIFGFNSTFQKTLLTQRNECCQFTAQRPYLHATFPHFCMCLENASFNAGEKWGWMLLLKWDASERKCVGPFQSMKLPRGGGVKLRKTNKNQLRQLFLQQKFFLVPLKFKTEKRYHSVNQLAFRSS
jgi:hypothetical protein